MKCKTLLSYYSHDEAVCFLIPFPPLFPDSMFLQKHTVFPWISAHFLISTFLPHPLVHNIRQVPPSKKHPSPLHHFLSNIIKGTICISLTRMMRYLIFYKHTYQYLSAKCIMVLTMAGLITNHCYTRLQSMASAHVSFFKNNYISNKGLKMAFHSWDLVEFCHTLQMGRYHEQDT